MRVKSNKEVRDEQKCNEKIVAKISNKDDERKKVVRTATRSNTMAKRSENSNEKRRASTV